MEKPRWRIEQKVGRAIDFPFDGDRARMLRDGYVCSIDTPDGDTMRCPRCEALLTLPVFEKAEFACPRCEAAGVRKCNFIDGYFPLVDKTLLYLERWHPEKGGAKASEEIKAANRRKKESQLRDSRNYAESLALEHWKTWAEIPTFGYGGRKSTPHSYGNYAI